MDYQALHKQIREKSLARVYLLHGEEEYVKERMWESLRACAVPETLPELNEHILNAPDASQIVAAAETLPVMAEHKLVAVHDYALLSGGRPKEEAAQLKALEACFARMQSDTCLVFFQRGEVAAKNKLRALIAKYGQEVLFARLSSAELEKWIYAAARREGLSINQQAVSAMAYYAGPMVADVNNELQKLMQYVAPRREITLDDVERLVQQGVQYTVFEWVEQVATRQVDKAGRLLAAMRSDGEDALHVISLAARQFRLILKMQLMQQDGMQPAAIDKKMGVPPFVARKVRAQARYFKPEETERALAKLLEAEWMIKSGQWRQSELALDMVLQSIMVRG